MTADAEQIVAVPLDVDHVAMLARELLSAMRAHYHRRPTARATALEVLNALAIVTAYVMAGASECGEEDEARGFFTQAFEAQLADMIEQAQQERVQ